MSGGNASMKTASKRETVPNVVLLEKFFGLKDNGTIHLACR